MPSTRASGSGRVRPEAPAWHLKTLQLISTHFTFPKHFEAFLVMSLATSSKHHCDPGFAEASKAPGALEIEPTLRPCSSPSRMLALKVHCTQPAPHHRAFMCAACMTFNRPDHRHHGPFVKVLSRHVGLWHLFEWFSPWASGHCRCWQARTCLSVSSLEGRHATRLPTTCHRSRNPSAGLPPETSKA